MEFLLQQFINPFVCGILQVNKIEDHHIVLLPVAMATSDALLDALRVPRQIVIHHHRAKLQVNAFCTRFGCNHDLAFVAKVINQRRAHIRSSRTAYFVRSLVSRVPFAINRIRLRVAIRAIE